MYWFLLAFLGTFFEEATNTITKKQSLKYNIIQVWIIISFFSLIFFFLWGVIKILIFHKHIYVNPHGLFLLWVRIFFEILQSYFTIIAIKKADRSTFALIRILTIPLLVIVDIILWYSFSFLSVLGLVIILLIFIIISLSKNKINFTWWWYVLFTTINAVITLSLFKYSISVYGDSVEFDQFIVIFCITLFYLTLLFKNKYKIPNVFKDRLFLLQWVSMWIATVLLSFSYLFFNASIATAIKRGGEMFWSILYWYKVFNEKNIKYKLLIAFFLFIWIVLASM